MGILNRRNAVLGWVALAVGKRIAKRKARSATPAFRVAGVVAGLAAGLGGLLLFRRKRRGGSGG